MTGIGPTAVAGLVTVDPGFEVIEMVFGLGPIVWFVGIGVALLRSGPRPSDDLSAVRRSAAG